MVDGDFAHPGKLTSKGQLIINKTKDRRAAPLYQSKYQDKENQFLPVYSVQQLTKKNKHTLDILGKLNKNIIKYNELPDSKKLQIDLTIVEELLAHPDTELYTNVMAQGRDPVIMVLNRGIGNYSLKNHISTFERRPEISKYNSYITNYVAKQKQIRDFDRSNSSVRYLKLKFSEFQV